MLHICARLSGTILLVAASAAASAQPNNPGNMPTGPAGRPAGMGTNDSATNPDLEEQLNRARMNGTKVTGETHEVRIRTRPAKPEEVTLGAGIRDRKGLAVGTVERVEADGAIVATAAGRVKVPLDAFGMDQTGLVIGLTKKEFDALVQSANAAPAG